MKATSQIQPPVRYEQMLQASLGSFWSDAFEGQADLQSILSASGSVQRQVDQDTELATLSIGRDTLPALRSYRVRPMRVRESDLQVFRRDLVYGAEPSDPRLYGSSTADAYYSETGSLANSKDGQEWSGPFRLRLLNGLRRVSSITDRPARPSASLFPGHDFRIVINPAGHWLEFEKNPFQQGFEVRYDPDGKYATFWMWGAGYDHQLAYEHFGWLPELAGENLPPDRELQMVNAVWDTITAGSSHDAFSRAVSSLTGVPVVGSDHETVEVVLSPPHVPSGTTVVTDRSTYVHPPGVDVDVSSGQEVHRGQFLTGSVRVYSGDDYGTRMEEDGTLTDLVLHPDWFEIDLGGPLTFENQGRSVTVDDSGPHTTVRWTLQGDAADITAFWDYVDQAAQNGMSVARELSGLDRVEPREADIPPSINPARWLLDHVLPSAVVLYIDGDRVDLNADEERRIARLNRLLPPHTPLLVLIHRDSGNTLRYGGMVETG